MAFQTKDFASITASMINWMKSVTRKVTDFNIGSIVRSMLEAIAAEIDELYQQMFIGLKEAIPVSVYNSFDFDAVPALPTSGLVRVTIASNANPVIISAGTAFTVVPNGNVDYISAQDVVIAAGDTFADILVTAILPGTLGNIAAGESFTLTPAPDGFVSATNLSPFINGVDEEDENDRKLRFNAYIQSLNRGTVAAVKYGLKTTALTDAAGNQTERVVAASVVEPYLEDGTLPVAWVQCYVHNGVGSTSSSLVNRAREVIYGYYDEQGNAIPGWKAAGVNVDVHAATEQLIDVAGVLTPMAGFDKPTLVAEAQQSVFAYIQGLDIGETAIRAEIVAIVMNITGVYNFVPSAPAGDTTADNKTKLMPGTISIT